MVRLVDRPEDKESKGLLAALQSFVQSIFGGERKRAQELQVVLLDHGLYREMDNEVRINYCQLWKNLIIRDDEKVIEVPYIHVWFTAD